MWTAYSACHTLLVSNLGDGRGMPWKEALYYSLGAWMTWIPLTLALHCLVQRYTIERGNILRPMAILALASMAVVVARAGFVFYSNPFFHWYGSLPLPPFREVLITSINNNLFLTWSLIGISHGLVFQQRTREREQRLAVLEAQLTASQLDALRAQLNPHFLFNVLNSVAEMVHINAELADRMLVSLSSLLRDSLSPNPSQHRPLHEELALVEHYLTIEKIRLGERLEVEWRVEPRCRDLRIPSLALLPLVENAIVHGIARRRAPGWLRILAHTDGDRMVLEVLNSVAAEASAPGLGIGLHSTRSRLDLLYGERASLRQCMADAETYSVQLEMPAEASHVAATQVRA